MAAMTLEEFNALPAASRVSLRRYGQRTRLVLNDVTLAAGVAQSVALNTPDRLELIVENTGSANAATLTDSMGKTVAQGDVVQVNGGSYALSALEDGEATGRELFGISTAGTTLHIEEVVGYGDVVQLPAGITPL